MQSEEGKIYVIYRSKRIVLEEKEITAKEILKRLGLSREYAFVVKDGNILDENEIVREGEEVRVVNAISGGKI